MKPKLLLVTSGLGLGGAEALLIDLAVLLRSQDWDVNIASLSPHGHHRETLETLGFQVSDFGMDRGTSRTNLSALVRALAKLRQSEADIVQCWMQHANFVGGLAALLRRSRPTYYGIFSSSMDFANYPPLSKTVFKSAAMLSRNTEGIVYNGIKAAEDHEKAGYSNDKRILVGNSVNFKRFRPCAESRLKIRQQLQIPEKDRVVVIAARNDPQKDWESMLNCAQQLPNITFLATGLDTEKLDGPSNVLTLGARRDIEAIYAASDAFMLLSNYGEGTSVAMSEAMATGLPIITTDTGDNARVVRDDAGIVVSSGDAIAAATGISNLFSNPEKYQQYAETALQRVLEISTPEAAFAPLLKSYENALRNAN